MDGTPHAHAIAARVDAPFGEITVTTDAVGSFETVEGETRGLLVGRQHELNAERAVGRRMAEELELHRAKPDLANVCGARKTQLPQYGAIVSERRCQARQQQER